LRVLVAGATGFIGRALVERLEQCGHEVVVLVRAPCPASRCEQRVADFRHDTDPAAWVPRLHGIDAVVNAVGILHESGEQTFRALHVQAPQALFAACAATGVRKVLQVSALGAEVGAASGYHRSKGEADRYLATLPLQWFILRPSLVFGPHGASTRLFYTLAAAPRIPLPGDGMQRLQPVHLDDLTRLCVRLLEGDHRPQVIAVVGPQRYTVRGLLAACRAGLGLGAPRFFHVPLALVRACARLPRVRFDAEALDMLERGNVASLEAFEAALGAAPRPPLLLPPGAGATGAHPLADWARLNALLPLLRAAVALVWIVTGLLSLGIYPLAESYGLLARVGIPAPLAPLFLYGAAVLDLTLGVAVLCARRRRWLWRAQIALILGYTLIITVALPQFWLHPFGPVLKNLPLLALLVALDVFERRA